MTEDFNPKTDLTPEMKSRRTKEFDDVQGKVEERSIDGYDSNAIIGTAVNMYRGEVRDMVFSIIATEKIRENFENKNTSND